MRKTLALVGCGHMGSALLKGWLQKKLPYDITVIQPDPLPEGLPLSEFEYKSSPAPSDRFDVIVLAVKPQVIKETCKAYIPIATIDTLIVSIAAGTPLKTFAAIFGAHQPVVRVMPNTPAAIGQGISAGITSSSVTSVQKSDVETLLTAAGAFLWLDDEAQIDAVTAVSGSGPAYVFYMIEALTKAGETAGLSPDISMQLARQTVIGAGALAAHQPDTQAAKLRQNVTSPNGTTETALKVLMDGRYQDILNEAVLAAALRSKELSA